MSLKYERVSRKNAGEEDSEALREKFLRTCADQMLTLC